MEEALGYRIWFRYLRSLTYIFTHWGRARCICINHAIIVSDNGFVTCSSQWHHLNQFWHFVKCIPGDKFGENFRGFCCERLELFLRNNFKIITISFPMDMHVYIWIAPQKFPKQPRNSSFMLVKPFTAFRDFTFTRPFIEITPSKML